MTIPIVQYLLVYLFGGLTLIPILLVLFLSHAFATQPVVDLDAFETRDPLELKIDDPDNLPDGISQKIHESESAAAYFVVCREFTPAVMLGKSVDKTIQAAPTPQGTSPSVYQTMYRSIFERGKSQVPTIDPAAKNNKSRNTFFIVIRFGTLMFYDNADSAEVRHVISLSYYDVDIYGGDEDILEGELFVKRNCIRMLPKVDNEHIPKDSKPFYLFTTDCSAKEDFYHAMLHNQRRDGQNIPKPLEFEESDMEQLIRDLHSSKAHFDTRWFNALLGRVFLSLYKTSTIEQLIRQKIEKKLARVVKPAFITSLQIKTIDLGHSPPLVTNPKLKELTKAGDLTIEADITYKGNARIDVAAIARIDLGPRFKVREVNILLATICKSLEGHMLFRVKPPPSNRLWFSFDTMPKMDLSIEPVVSSRQITYSLILRAIESRLREVIAETLVSPNWDDIPFSDSFQHLFRGGLWEDDSIAANKKRLSNIPILLDDTEEAQLEDDQIEQVEKLLSESSADAQIKDSLTTVTQRTKSRSSSVQNEQADDTVALSSSVEPLRPKTSRSMRTRSFASAAIPIISHSQAIVEAQISPIRQFDAASTMKDISSRSNPTTPTDTPVGSPSDSILKLMKDKIPASRRRTIDSDTFTGQQTPDSKSSQEEKVAKTFDDISIVAESSNTEHAKTIKKQSSFASTAAAAKKWGLEFVGRHSPSSSITSVNIQKVGEIPPEETITNTVPKETLGSKTNPIGRGQPFPPPGVPLPGPPKPNRLPWAGMLGRKAPTSPNLGPTSNVPAFLDTTNNSKDNNTSMSSVSPRSHTPDLEDESKNTSIPRPKRQSEILTRKRLSGYNINSASNPSMHHKDDEGILIIKAPNNEGDTDSISSSYSSKRNSNSQPSLKGLALQSISVNDLTEIPTGDMDDLDISSKPTSAHPDNEQSHSSIHLIDQVPVPAPVPQAEELDSRSTSTSQPYPPNTTATSENRHGQIPAPITTSAPSRVEAEFSPTSVGDFHSPTSSNGSATFPRKVRSRQSLIPTPSSSRKHSPTERIYRSSTPTLGRRTSTLGFEDISDV